MQGLFRFVSVLALVGIAGTSFAQFGHPLKGSWSGEWGPNKIHALLELNWDGKVLTGTINPGPNAVPLRQASVDPATWAVHFEADAKDGAGTTVHYVIDGKLENLGAYYRFMTGTWSQGTTKGEFKLTRN